MAPRKTGQEAKVERLTWFAMIIAFLFMNNNNVEGAWILITISFILLGSGLYQWRKRWSVGPVVGIAGGIGFAAGLYGLYTYVFVDLALVAFVIILAVIGLGVVTNDS